MILWKECPTGVWSINNINIVTWTLQNDDTSVVFEGSYFPLKYLTCVIQSKKLPLQTTEQIGIVLYHEIDERG